MTTPAPGQVWWHDAYAALPAPMQLELRELGIGSSISSCVAERGDMIDTLVLAYADALEQPPEIRSRLKRAWEDARPSGFLLDDPVLWASLWAATVAACEMLRGLCDQVPDPHAFLHGSGLQSLGRYLELGFQDALNRDSDEPAITRLGDIVSQEFDRLGILLPGDFSHMFASVAHLCAVDGLGLEPLKGDARERLRIEPFEQPSAAMSWAVWLKVRGTWAHALTSPEPIRSLFRGMFPVLSQAADG